MIVARHRKFQHQVWATYRQFQELGAQVRAGEKGTLIVKYGEWVPKTKRDGAGEAGQNEDDEAGKRLYAKAAFVFNIDQVDAPTELRARLVPPETPRADLTTRLAEVDDYVAAIGVDIRHGGQRAFYRHPSSNGEGDFIQMPPRELFTGTATSTPTESYYATLLHEEIHASGAESRLDRKLGRRYGTEETAMEELIAEIGSAFLCAKLGVTNVPRPDHAQYVASWLTVLKNDTRAIFSAAAAASIAVDYLNKMQPMPPTPSDPIRIAPMPDAPKGVT